MTEGTTCKSHAVWGW